MDAKTQKKLNVERDQKLYRTYLFKYFDADPVYGGYYPCYPWFDPEGLSDDVPQRDKEFLEVELYSHLGTKSRPYYTRLYQIFFDRIFTSHVRTNCKWVMLPKSQHKKFTAIVKRHNLQTYSDFLLECICIAQEVLAKEIIFWEAPENQNLKKNARGQAETMAEIVSMYKESKAPGKVGQTKQPPIVKSITVEIGGIAKKIDLPFLLDEIMQNGFEKTVSQWSGKDGKDGVSTYAKSFDDYPFKNDFKFNLALAFYHFLVELKLFSVTDENLTPNDLMRCIAGLIELCLIPIGSEGQSENNKIKGIRNWIRRKM